MYKIFRKLAFKAKLLIKEISFEGNPKQKIVILKDVPYYPQYKEGDDASWRKSGAKSKKEYLHWSINGCGMACFKMILEYQRDKKVPFVTLGKQCLRYGGYRLDIEAYKRDDFVNSLPGLFYKGFVNFAENEYGIKSQFVTPLVIKEIVSKLAKGNLVMASVNGEIRDTRNKPLKKGGHIVLMVGYDLNKQIFYLHNPSGIPEKSQKYASVGFKDFSRFFANRGVIIFPK